MEEKELMKLWKQHDESTTIVIDQELLQTEVENRVVRLNKLLAKRNAREIAVALIMIPIGLILGIVMPDPFVKTGCLLIVPYSLLVIYMLRKTQNAKAEPDTALAQKDFLQLSLRYINKEIRLLNTVLYWYIMPAAISAGLVLWGISETLPKLIVSYIILAGMMLFIYILNKRAVKEELEPHKKSILDAIEKINKP